MKQRTNQRASNENEDQSGALASKLLYGLIIEMRKNLGLFMQHNVLVGYTQPTIQSKYNLSTFLEI